MDHDTKQDLVDPPGTEASGRWCVHCGADADETWAFCGSCGRALNQSDPVVAVSQARRPSRSTWVLTSLAGALVVALAAGAGFVYQQMRTDLEDTRTQLASTRDQLQGTRSSLAETEQSLADSRTELAAANGQLDSTQARLRTARRQLSGLQGSLSSAQDRLDLQANQIETLKTCLDGVTSAMSYAAYDDYGAAIAALDAVEVSCNRAFELF